MSRPEILMPARMTETASSRRSTRISPCIGSICATIGRPRSLRSRRMPAPSLAGGGVDAALIDALPHLEIIAHFGVGYDNVDVGRAAQKGVIVTNTPDVLTEEVADTALGLAAHDGARSSPHAERHLRAGALAAGDLSADAGDAARAARPALSASAASARRSPAGSRPSACRSSID